MAGEEINPYAAAASSLVDFGINSIMTSSANAKSKRASEKSAWLNFAMQNYFMDKQNEYNKPVNQMKRLREAGLNPNLVYGNANAVIASASPSGGGVDTAGVRSSSKLELASAMNMLRNQELQNKELEARTKAINNDYEIARARLGLEANNQAFMQDYNLKRLQILSEQLQESINRNVETERHNRESEKPWWRRHLENGLDLGILLGNQLQPSSGSLDYHGGSGKYRY